MRKLIESTVNRLRLCHVECAGLDTEIRKRRLDDTVNEATRSVAPRDRRAFITRLLEQFPVWEGRVEPVEPARAAIDESLLEDPDFLTSRLARLLKSLPEGRRKAIARELARAGLPKVGKPLWPEPADTQLRRSLAAELTGPLDAGRVLELLSLLATVVLDLDDVAWMTWRDMADGNVPLRRGANLRQAMARCLTGDADTPPVMVAEGIGRVRQLLAHMISTIPLVGRFAAQQVRHFSPAEIKRSLKWERKRGFFQSESARAWKKYESISRAFDEDAFATAVRTAIAGQVNEWVCGPHAEQSASELKAVNPNETKAPL